MKQTKNKPKLPKRVRNHVNPLSDQAITVFEGFGNTKPIMVDIGAYRGEFAEQLVEYFRDTHNFIVTEIRKPYAHYLRELFSDQDGVAVFDGDSAKNITNLLSKSISQGSLIDYIFINFPDPWFKEKHKKRRVVNNDFLSQLSQMVDSQTKIVFQTDQKNMFEETMELVTEHGEFAIEYFSEPLWGIQSYWESMKISEGDTINRAVFTKK